MHVDDTTIKTALHEIFDDFRVYSGGSLMLRDIDAEWSRTGLRQSDLFDGIERLLRDGHIDVELQRDGLAVRLLTYEYDTSRGVRALTSAAGSAATLVHLRRRRRETSPGRGRRQEDRAGELLAAAG